MAVFLKELRLVEEQIRVVMRHETTVRDEDLGRTGDQILSLLSRFDETLRISGEGQKVPGVQAHTDMEILGGLMKELDRNLSEMQDNIRKQGKLPHCFHHTAWIFLPESVTLRTKAEQGKPSASPGCIPGR